MWHHVVVTSATTTVFFVILVIVQFIIFLVKLLAEYDESSSLSSGIFTSTAFLVQSVSFFTWRRNKAFYWGLRNNLNMVILFTIPVCSDLLHACHFCDPLQAGVCFRDFLHAGRFRLGTFCYQSLLLHALLQPFSSSWPVLTVFLVRRFCSPYGCDALPWYEATSLYLLEKPEVLVSPSGTQESVRRNKGLEE